MSADRSPGEPSRDTKKAADVLVEGLGGLLRAQLSVASGDVTKAAAVTQALETELECMRKDAASINQYCHDCENKLSGTGGDGSLSTAFSAIDACFEEATLLEDMLGQMEAHMAQLEERWGRLKQ